jgi:drug/metabolite transporter (DMT)-like permease
MPPTEGSAAPGQAGQSMYLMPVFGTALAVLFLGERLYGYHAVRVALIAAGLVLCVAAQRQPESVRSLLRWEP